MELQLFATNPAGNIPLDADRPIYKNEKLRIMIIPDPDDTDSLNDLQLEIINPIELLVFSDTLPPIEPTKLLFFDITIPTSWLAGKYRIGVYSRKNKSMTKIVVFRLLTKRSGKMTIKASLTPKWRLRYSFKVNNPTNKPIGNFNAFIALPKTIYPQQLVKNLEIMAKGHKLATDVEGNHWARIEMEKIDPNDTKELGYSALIENKALVVARTLADNISARKYHEEFYQKYLQSEPHIESDHPEIIAFAEKIPFRNPINFAKEAVKSINRYLTYQIQEQEYGAAYAILNRIGDCTEYAALFVAMCRAAGIPARTAAGFTFNNKRWERHATAEFMVAGRWVPIDPTGQNQSDIFLGALPANIIITRGNWMGHTLTKEASYKYRIMDPDQKLRVDISWKIDLEDPKDKHGISHSFLSSSVRILDTMEKKQKAKETRVVSSPSNIRILNPPQTSNIKNSTSTSPLIQLPTAKKQSKKGKKIELVVDLPDILKTQKKLLAKITLENNMGQKLAGVIEIRELTDEVIKIYALSSKILPAQKKITFAQRINLEGQGSSEYEFVFLNRIGRTLANTKKKLTLF